LSVSRATVAAGAEPEYLTIVGELARLSTGRGRRLWLFRAPGGGRFLECSESVSAAEHRTAARSPDEARLEQRLRELARYDRDAWELWEEVPL
jgi:hypothetical protein